MLLSFVIEHRKTIIDTMDGLVDTAIDQVVTIGLTVFIPAIAMYLKYAAGVMTGYLKG